MDGLWSGPTPTSTDELVDWDHDDGSTGRPKDFAKYFVRCWCFHDLIACLSLTRKVSTLQGDGSPSILGSNRVPLWEDPQKRLSTGSFTSFVFVCLNDQVGPSF